MRSTVPAILTMTLISLAALYAKAADPDAGADEKALRAACDSYVKAVNSGDVAAVMKHWAPDADYINDSGEKFTGRAALGKLFKDSLANTKDKKFSFETTSIRAIAPGVAVEDGVGRLIGSDDDEQSPGTRDTAVWTKSGDNWLLSSVRDLGDLPEDASKNPSQLKKLDWLVGEWQSTDALANVDMTCAAALDGKFLKQKYEVKAKNGEGFTVVSMIGWDPAANQLHSWYFDSRGGFGEGQWTRDGNSWKIAAGGIVADGRTGTSTNIWKFIDSNTISWTSKDRELGGVPMPENEVKFVRKTEEPKPTTTSQN